MISNKIIRKCIKNYKHSNKKKNTLTVYFSAKHVEYKSKRKNYEKMYCDAK